MVFRDGIADAKGQRLPGFRFAATLPAQDAFIVRRIFMMQTQPGFIVPPAVGPGRTMMVFGQTITERITAEDSDGAYYVFDEVTPPGMGVPPHSHTREDEIVFIRAGMFEVFLNGNVTRVEPGAILNFARGSWHGFRCLGPEPGQTTWVVTPGLGAQTLLRDLSALPPGPPDLALLNDWNTRFGVTMPPPSPTWW
jgi:quercetin dioxygenase-like cupin family protein